MPGAPWVVGGGTVLFFRLRGRLQSSFLSVWQRCAGWQSLVVEPRPKYTLAAADELRYAPKTTRQSWRPPRPAPPRAHAPRPRPGVVSALRQPMVLTRLSNSGLGL